jgi:hypothetical protein
MVSEANCLAQSKDPYKLKWTVVARHSRGAIGFAAFAGESLDGPLVVLQG